MTRAPTFISTQALVATCLVGLTLVAGPALAQNLTPPAPPAPPSAPASPSAPEPAEAAMEAATTAFEARMEGFGRRAEAIAEAKGLSEAQREGRMAALWSEYQPEVAVFTAAIAEHAGAIAAAALADVDLKAIVNDALNDPEVQQVMAEAQTAAVGMATNGAWAQADPEQMITYGLMAQYGLDQALDAVQADEEAAMADAEAAEAPSPPPAPKTPHAH